MKLIVFKSYAGRIINLFSTSIKTFETLGPVAYRRDIQFYIVLDLVLELLFFNFTKELLEKNQK